MKDEVKKRKKLKEVLRSENERRITKRVKMKDEMATSENEG